MLNICHDELRTSLLHPDQKITAGDRNLWLDLRNQTFHLTLKHNPTKDELCSADLAETIMQIMDQGDISIQKTLKINRKSVEKYQNQFLPNKQIQATVSMMSIIPSKISPIFG